MLYSFKSPQAKALVGIIGGTVALMWAATYVEARTVKKTEGNVRVHQGENPPNHRPTTEADAVTTHPRPAADSKTNKSRPSVAEYR